MDSDTDHRRLLFEVERAKIEFSEIQQELMLVNEKLSRLPSQSEIWEIAIMSILIGALAVLIPLGLIIYLR